MIVFWTDSAIKQLHDIFEFYKSSANVIISHKIINDIINKTILLEKHPKAGQREKLLTNREKEYRYLVEGNYKIIYWIDETFVNIAAVFDCRQNPVKMKNIK
jgi:plasmid stabilization system protein ParE